MLVRMPDNPGLKIAKCSLQDACACTMSGVMELVVCSSLVGQ